MNLFGYAATAGNLATLEHDRFQTGFGEIARSDQAVMSRSDDDYVAHQFQVSGFKFQVRDDNLKP